jgi:hypothetical protein
VGNGEDLLTRGSLGTELDLLLNLLFNLLLTLRTRTNDMVREWPSISIQFAQSYHDYDAVLAGRMDDSDRGERKRKKPTTIPLQIRPPPSAQIIAITDIPKEDKEFGWFLFCPSSVVRGQRAKRGG